jgi:tetratricopeptide (TPR) repeat protein
MTVSNLLRGLSVAALVLIVGAPDVLAQGTGRIRGQVLNDETDEPLAEATVYVELPNSARGALPVEVTTDEDGRFSVFGLQSGQWTATVSLEGFDTEISPVTVVQGTNAPVTFFMVRVRGALELALGDAAFEGLDAIQLQADLEAADAAYNAQQWDTAIAGYRALLEVLPQMADLHMQLGNAHRAMGAHEQALAEYDLILAEDPDNATAKTEIARTRLAMGDFDAAGALADAVDANSSREDLYNLGELEFARGAVDEAAGWYEKAAVADPNWEKPWYKLALVALNKGDMDMAKQHFQKVVDIAPNSEEGNQAQATLAALP